VGITGVHSPRTHIVRETWVRVYSDEDMGVLKRVKKLMDEGYKLRAAFERVVNEG